MTRRKPYTPVMTGVSFHPAVIDYLNRTSHLLECDRSALINRIVREHAQARGTPIEDRDLPTIPRIRSLSRAILR